MSKTILVTGGAGYIGTHTIVELHKAGYEIVVIDNFSNSSPKALERLEQIIGYTPTTYTIDLLDKEKLYDVFGNNTFSGVIHFAGLKSVGESTQTPLTYYHNNIVSTLNLCNVMSEYKVKNIVFSSSATVYGMDNEMPVDEEAFLNAPNPYGRTKLMIEEILKDLYKADSEWSISLLRYFNPVGAHESGLIGENPSGIPNNLMPFITNVATGKLEKLNVFGDDYNTIDGTGVRDYIHVTDLAEGHVKALEHNHSPGVNTYNMGTGNGYSVLQVIHAFEESNNIKIPFEIVARRPGDIGTCYAEVSKANKELNWKAKKDIHQMCKDAWKWQSSNPSGY